MGKRALDPAARVPCAGPHAARGAAQIIKLDDEYEKFIELGVLDHPYPPTKIMFMPSADCSNKDLFATAGDYLRVWQYTDTGTKLETVFNNVRGRASGASGPGRRLGAQVATIQTPTRAVQAERLLRPAHVLRLEPCRQQPARYLQHRHHVLLVGH